MQLLNVESVLKELTENNENYSTDTLKRINCELEVEKVLNISKPLIDETYDLYHLCDTLIGETVRIRLNGVTNETVLAQHEDEKDRLIVGMAQYLSYVGSMLRDYEKVCAINGFKV